MKDDEPQITESLSGLFAVQLGVNADGQPMVRVSRSDGSYQDLTSDQARAVGKQLAEGGLLSEALAAAHGVDPEKLRVQIKFPNEWKYPE